MTPDSRRYPIDIDLKTATKKEILDALRGYFEQAPGRCGVFDGNELVDEGFTCQYRGPVLEDGKRHTCAVGAMIPDAAYKTEFEGASAASLLERLGIENDGLQFLLNDIQSIHDAPRSWCGGVFKAWDKFNALYYDALIEEAL